jgi:[histone H3]-lysine79 N-trimethyltransferase
LNKQHSGSNSETDDDFQQGGTTTRRAWSDYCKGKSSQSEDELKERKKKMAKARKIGNKKQNPKTRLRKTAKRAAKITGLDVLHSHTVMSTADEAIGDKLPAAQGCIDAQLSSYIGTMAHEEIDDPTSYAEVPYPLKILLDMYKTQFMNFLNTMKSSTFKENLNRQIESEKEKNKRLMNRTGQLEKQIKVLVEDSVILLKARMQELGINTSSQNDLLCKAKEIVGKHKELQQMASKIQNQVNTLEEEHSVMLSNHMKKLSDRHKNPIDFELASKESHELVLKEIENVLNQRKNLKNKISTLEAEVALIEKTNDDRKVPTQDQPMPQQKPPQGNIFVSGNIYKTSQPSKPSRKSREHRQKTHEWPEIPEISKIEENNPEILAQKILETGRQIEAGKLSSLQINKKPAENTNYHKKSGHQTKQEQVSVSMPAPAQKSSKQTAPSNVHQGLPKAGGGGGKKGADSHKVVNFEDRLKSIITSALQGQDQQRQMRIDPSPPQQITPPIQQQQQQQSHSPKKIIQQQQQQPIFPNQQIIHVPVSPISPNNQQQTTSPIKNQRNQMVPLPQMAPHISSAEHIQMQQRMEQESTYVQLKRNEHMPNFAKAMNMMQGDTKIFARHPQMPPQQAQFMSRERDNVQMMYQQRQVVEEKREFKTPDNVRYERQDMGRSSVGSIENEYINCGSSSSGKSQTQRSSSSLSQPDYTQVSPAKLALRRHLSQEKLAQNTVMPQHGSNIVTKTIGDFINAEIEKTLEITPQSIINAVIQHNMPSNSRMGNESMMGMRDERELVDQHPYATLKPSSSKQQFMHDPYVDHRQKMMPTMKYAPASSNSTARKSAITSPPQHQQQQHQLPRHDEPINFMSLPPKSSPQERIHHQEATSSSSSYKIDTKVFTSNIGMSMRKEVEMKEHREEQQQQQQRPLEGLAATLMMRQQAIASMKIKEEADDSKYQTYSNHAQLPYPHIIKKECKLRLL